MVFRSFIVATCLTVSLVVSCSNSTDSTPTLNPRIATLTRPTTSSVTPPTETPIVPVYSISIVNPPPTELHLPYFTRSREGSLHLTETENIVAPNDRLIISANELCFSIDLVTISYSPDFEFATVATQCPLSENTGEIYLIHSNGKGIQRTIVGYDSYEAITNQPVIWSTDSQGFIYFRATGFSDAHLEVNGGFVRYEIETGNRIYLGKYLLDK